MSSDTDAKSRVRLAGFMLIASGVMMIPALLNGAPFLYFDSINYLSRPDKAVRLLLSFFGLEPPPSTALDTPRYLPDGGPLHQTDNLIGGRSIFYGVIAWASYPFGRLWPLVVFQSVLTAWVLGLLLLRVFAWRLWLALGATVLIALTTPIAFFAGLAMPDFLAPLTILCIALLAFHRGELGRWTILGLVIILLLAILSHASHLALAAALWAILAAVRLLGNRQTRDDISVLGLIWIALTLVLAVMSQQAERVAATQFADADLLKRPHLTAHLVDNGPGLEWINAHCATTGDAPFAICAYRDRLPVEWRDFLFNRSAEQGVFVARDTDTEAQRALSQQDFAFALAVARDDPSVVLGFAWREMSRQLRKIGIEGVPLDATQLAERQDWLPPDLRQNLEDAHIYRDRRPLELLSQATRLTAVLSVLLLMGISVLIALRVIPHPPRAIYWFIVVAALGVVLNAAICGIAASPYARFQARVVFLLPLAAIILIGSFAQTRKQYQISSNP